MHKRFQNGSVCYFEYVQIYFLNAYLKYSNNTDKMQMILLQMITGSKYF